MTQVYEQIIFLLAGEKYSHQKNHPIMKYHHLNDEVPYLRDKNPTIDFIFNAIAHINNSIVTIAFVHKQYNILLSMEHYDKLWNTL